MGALKPENKIDTKRRRKLVLELRKEGMLYKDIAIRVREQFAPEELPKGYDASYVGQDLRRALQNVESDLEVEAAEMLRLELRRLNEMQRALWHKVLTGDEKAADRVLKIMERRAKYLGLDEPEQIEGAFSVTDAEAYQDLRTAMMDALDGFPEARQAVAAALSESSST